MTHEEAEITAGIKKLAEMSRTPGHELIVECLDYHGLLGTRELTAEQIEKFLSRIKNKTRRSGHGNA